MRATEVHQSKEKKQIEKSKGPSIEARNQKRLANQANKQERSVNQGKRRWQIGNSNRSANLANKRRRCWPIELQGKRGSQILQQCCHCYAATKKILKLVLVLDKAFPCIIAVLDALKASQ